MMITPDMFDAKARELMAEADQLLQQDEHDEAEDSAKRMLVGAYIAGLHRFAWWQDGRLMVGNCGTPYKKACEEVLAEVSVRKPDVAPERSY